MQLEKKAKNIGSGKLLSYAIYMKSNETNLKVFSWVLPLLDVRHCCKLPLYTISRKTYDLKWRKWGKTLFGPDFGPLDPNLGRQMFFKEYGFVSH